MYEAWCLCPPLADLCLPRLHIQLLFVVDTDAYSSSFATRIWCLKETVEHDEQRISVSSALLGEHTQETDIVVAYYGETASD